MKCCEIVIVHISRTRAGISKYVMRLMTGKQVNVIYHRGQSPFTPTHPPLQPLLVCSLEKSNRLGPYLNDVCKIFAYLDTNFGIEGRGQVQRSVKKYAKPRTQARPGRAQNLSKSRKKILATTYKLFSRSLCIAPYVTCAAKASSFAQSAQG